MGIKDWLFPKSRGEKCADVLKETHQKKMEEKRVAKKILLPDIIFVIETTKGQFVKVFTAMTYNDPFSPEGYSIVEAEEEMRRYLTNWKSYGFETFGKVVVPYKDWLGGDVSHRNREHLVKAKVAGEYNGIR